MPLLHAILDQNNYDSETKLVAMIALGDLVLAVGSEQFMQYLQATKRALNSASELSLETGSNTEEAELL